VKKVLKFLSNGSISITGENNNPSPKGERMKTMMIEELTFSPSGSPVWTKVRREVSPAPSSEELEEASLRKREEENAEEA
jgi:hypothetical protein